MQNRYLSLMVVAFVCLATSGCARLTSIYRSENLPDDRPNLVTIDAKQRALLTNKVSDILRFCTEPPPDVFTALATSLGVDLSLPGGPDPANAAKIASTISENASTIERTQTVNVLREAMYRNCERYLSGAISNDEFIVQAARDQRLIIHVLAVEQITGVARAQAVALTTVAKAAASGVTDTGLEVLAGAKKDFEAKRTAADKLREAATAVAPTGPCGAKPIDTAALPTGVTAANAEAKNTKCAELAVAADREKEAQKYLGTVQEAITRQSEVSSTASGTATSAALSATQVSEAVAKQVVEIVKQNNAFDEIGMTCVIWMRDPLKKDSLPPYCEQLLEQMAQTRQAQLAAAEGIDLEAVELYRKELRSQTQSRAQAVWDYLGKGANLTDAEIDKLEVKSGAKIPIPRRVEMIAAGKDFNKFLAAFNRLVASKQVKLAQAAK